MENKKRMVQFLIIVFISFSVFYYFVFPNWENIKNFLFK